MRKKCLLLFISFTLICSSCSYKTKSSIGTYNSKTPVTYADIDEDEIDSDDSIIINDSLEEEKNCKEKDTDDTPIQIYDNMSTKEHSWFFSPNNEGLPPREPAEVIDLLNKYSGYYTGDTSKKELYLTFDEGYENGYTEKILDTLKKNNVKAAFFVVKPYIKSNPEIIKRMVDEGHLVCNHSAHHPSMASITDSEKFKTELEEVEKCYNEATGQEMPKFFRPPMGRYSELSLNYTKNLGYKSIFWSLAYYDWDVKKQPNPDFAKEILLRRTHNGSIILLHAVSKTNAEILDDLINSWKTSGYEFKTLNDIK